MKPSIGCSGITNTTSFDPELRQPGAVRTKLDAGDGSDRKVDGARQIEMAVEKQESEKPLSNFPTATTTTKYTQLWDTDSRGKSTPTPRESGGRSPTSLHELHKRPSS